MVMTFRVSELQMLLGYAGKNKTGRKNELQSRAIEIVRLRNPAIQAKIKELYKSIQYDCPQSLPVSEKKDDKTYHNAFDVLMKNAHEKQLPPKRSLRLEMMSFGDRSQAAASGPTGIHPAQKVPMGLNTIAGYAQAQNVGSIGGVTSTHSSSRYSSSSSQVAPTSISTAVGYSTLTSNSHNSSYPINPDVKLKKLPFYDILGELLKPSSLAPQGSGRYQESTFAFSLTPHQANKIANSRDLRPGKQDYSVQVQMRFCLLETTCEQEDNFPPNIAVKINEKMCPLPTPIPTNKPGVEPKRPSRPVNVTALCRISPTVTNRIQVSWASEYGRCYVISVYLVQKLSSDDLLQRLKNRGAKIADFTRSLIKQKLQEDADCEIATTSLRCSLMCPLGKMRMMLPCRASTCDHLQCFDASLYLQMNERKPTWTCPVCDKPAVYDCLVIDGYFQEVLQQNSSCNEVTLHKDGGWTPLMPKKEKEPEVEKRKSEVAVETLSDDSDDDTRDQDDAPIVEEVNNKKKSAEPEIITLTDSEEDDDDSPPPAKRPNNGSSSVPVSTASATGTAGNTTPHGSEGTKSNDSWCVGEVDPGKRLVFRKSLSSSSNGTGGLLTTAGGSSGGAAFSPPSSGSVSPQVICLDSPASSPSPPPRRPNQGPSPLPAGLTVTPVVSTSSSSSSPTFSSGSSELRQVINVTSRSTPPITASSNSTSSSSPSPHTTITPLSSSSGSSVTISSSTTNAPSFLTPSSQDPLAVSTFNIQPTSSAAAAAAAAAVAAAGLNPNPYSLPPALQNLFNPLGIMPPTTVSGSLPFRPQDRYM
ncbi:E3 SUMO-protein ligase PIAS2 isoform X1 [Procambarus clarkii]|uniref:E3 SUMO-protein ligase PIAS2 isoform X1 n=1 Tax=Procambarus clarkii TaxID=6728 RepID=UPI001E6754DE|nr:E3 SUMO-protein ligase PIAS2-like isoform X3 [Procambarus clarkii]XP_045613190.1 E3 SUMO-protein ligase PIAS2-like isoform X3 [Procambarus clarkii]